MATDRVSQVEASRQGLQQEILALEQLAELRRLNRRLLDKTAASDAALAFLKERRIKEDGEDDAATQEWTEIEKNELTFFKAAREFDSDPRKTNRKPSWCLSSLRFRVSLCVYLTVVHLYGLIFIPFSYEGRGSCTLCSIAQQNRQPVLLASFAWTGTTFVFPFFVFSSHCRILRRGNRGKKGSPGC